jgi:hypothetical protein
MTNVKRQMSNVKSSIFPLGASVVTPHLKTVG